MTTKVFRISGKCKTFWNSQISRRYKSNNINGDSYGAFKIASDFDEEIYIITKKYLDTEYPIGCIKSVVSDFQKNR